VVAVVHLMHYGWLQGMAGTGSGKIELAKAMQLLLEYLQVKHVAEQLSQINGPVMLQKYEGGQYCKQVSFKEK
jgi:hypothetical protein